MQKAKVTINYKVPSWHFCNDDRLDGGELTKHTCRFCIKTGKSYTCVLYDQSLYSDGTLIQKTDGCKRACVGLPTEVTERDTSNSLQVPPKEIMKQTIDTYTKHVKELRAQGYPQAMAETFARKFTLE